MDCSGGRDSGHQPPSKPPESLKGPIEAKTRILSQTSATVICLNRSMNTAIYWPVRYWKTSLMVLFAGSWLAASSHCAWEQLPGLSFLVCSPASGPSQSSPASHCADGFCQSVEEGNYLRSQQHSSDLVPAVAELCTLLNLVEVSIPTTAGVGVIVGIPPELRKTWQFASRTALPPRAPSFAS